MSVQEKQIAHQTHNRWDLFGMVLSLACGIHCIALPALLGALPLLGVEFFHDPGFEWFMVGMISVLAAAVFSRGFFIHRKPTVFVALGVGLVSFLFVRPWVEGISHEATHVVTLFGGLAFILGHWYNAKWTRARCRRCQH